MNVGLVSSIIGNLPEVTSPTEKRQGFKQKLIWTLIMLVAYFILAQVPLYGLGANALQTFEQLSIILGASFGSIISLGIGPIVTASIVLQLLTGSGLLKLDTSTPEGRKFFQGLQKLLGLFFVIFEAIVYVYLGGLSPQVGIHPMVLVGQLILGGILIMLMDEVITKWGFGSGISLFIVAGVSQSILIQAFSPLVDLTTADGGAAVGQFFWNSPLPPVGQVLVFFISLMATDVQSAALALGAILATVLVFVFAVYAQAMKIEIPLTFGRARGHGIRWPLSFLYTSNIPVILIAALLANVQIAGQLLNKPGIVDWVNPPNILQSIILVFFRNPFPWTTILPRVLVYVLLMVVGSVIFSIFWVQTSGMDAGSQAKQIMNSGLQIPGFRRDERVLERILQRYIFPLTVMGGITVGILAALADVSGALSRGTGILLAVMILYKMYEDIARQHMMDMHPAMQKFLGG
ncbi:preprotein translocase subunit SecY [archaeon]|nr:preprotein translocase subunit SecY [archaeon]